MLIIVGLMFDIAAAFILSKALLEIVLTVVANSLIVGGVWGELWFLKRARQADDSRVAEAEKEAAHALARAAETDRARVELEVKLQPRMTDQRQFDLIQSLRGKLYQITIAYETDAETVWFANSLRDAFWAAGLRVAQYPRASAVHSFGMFVYDPGMKGAKLSEIGEVLVDIFRGTGTVLAVIGALPSDVPASVENPAIIIGGRFLLPPAHLVPALAASGRRP